MIKLLSLLTSITISAATTLSVTTYLAEKNQNNEVPSWVKSMVQSNPNQIKVGYDHYSLINKKHDEQDTFQQKDWMDFSQNKNLYIYLPKANNIDQAINNITIDDSAVTWTIGIQDPVTWTKIDDSTYTNNRFITQDTTVSSIALMDTDKHQAVKNSKKWNQLTTQEKAMFDKYGILSASRQGKKQDWWSANHWEKNLATEKNLSSSWSAEKNQKFSQLDLYNRWINQEMIGMNVPLSLIEKNSFILKETNINHLFAFSSTIKQVWNDNNENMTNIATPHWGFTLKINDNQDILFQTPQIINLQNAFKSETINSYLNEKQYFSFNSQEDTKFKSNYLIDYSNNSPFNDFLILPAISSALILIFLFNLKYFGNWKQSFAFKNKNKLQEVINGKKEKSN